MKKCICGKQIPVDWNYCNECLAWLRMDNAREAREEESDRAEAQAERDNRRYDRQ